jgi:CTP:molybdopterin cytidylyltransferase MocA
MTKGRAGSRRALDIGIVLAAGASSRMGSAKALLSDGSGRTFLERITASLRRGGCAAVIVVAGRHAQEIASALPAGALLALNSRWEKGQLESARVGLERALDLEPRVVLLHLVDMPLVRASDVARALEAARSGRPAIACHRGVPGHPLALPALLARRLCADKRAKTLHEALERLGVAPRQVAGSPGCVRSANTKEELAVLLGGAAGRVSRA